MNRFSSKRHFWWVLVVVGFGTALGLFGLGTSLQLVLLLGFKHLLFDFILQTDRMMREKGQARALGGYLHAGQHGLATGFILLFFAPLWVVVLVVLLETLVHYLIDWTKVQWSSKGAHRPDDQLFWFTFGLDQYLHLVTYVVIVRAVLGATGAPS